MGERAQPALPGSIVTDDAAQIAALLHPGQRVFVAGAVAEPSALVSALATQSLPRGLTFVQFPLAGFNEIDFTALTADARLTCVFMTPALKQANPDRLAFLPMHMRQFYDYLATGVDVALIQVGRDPDGNLRAAPNVDFLGAVLDSPAQVLAELNEALIVPRGAPLVPPQRLAAVLRTARPLPTPATPAPDAVARAIGERVADLIDDGDCVQTGIGAIPAAILEALAQKNDLGWHGGLIDDAVLALIRRGVVTGASKSIDRHVHVTGMALCSAAGHAQLAELDAVHFRGANYTHDAEVIRRLRGFVSVNSAVQVDLSGQVNAEVVAGRQISGTGGSVDFMRAARRSPGGRSIVALGATARGGTVSRIVSAVEHVTALRTDVDMVVTEHGVARLRDLPLPARREALIEIAAPGFRDALRAGDL
ncbi:MAG: acetyl-CoA hydrolase/transferase C-terminal domain-containing protein [Pseudomonadota bacterium]